MIFGVLALSWYAADQLTKVLAVRELADGPKPVIGDLLTLRLAFNPGAAFSTGTGLTWMFTCLAIVATVFLLYVSRRLRASLVWAVALGLVLGGVAGNLTDRLMRDPGPFHGHVVDFLQLPHWPIFNIADIGINVGIGLIILQTLRGIQIDGTPDRQPQHDAETGVEA